MLKNVYDKYCAINEQLEKDKELIYLRKRLKTESTAFDDLLDRLSADDQQIIVEYMGICAEIDERIVEIAAFNI